MALIAGIDYGLKGAIAVLLPRDDAGVRVWNLYEDGKLQTVAAGLERGVRVFVEDFMGRYATKSQFEAAIRYGRLLGALEGRGCVVVRVPASEWKREAGLVDKKKTTYAQRKQRSLDAARVKWPMVQFDRADQAEAALLADHGARSLR